MRIPFPTPQAMATKTVNKKAKASSASASGRTLWLPNVESPEWLDGSLPGDAGAFASAFVTSPCRQLPPGWAGDGSGNWLGSRV